MQFIEYIQRLSESLGEHQLPIDRNFVRAREIVHPDALHYPIMKQMVVAMYRNNHCSNPTDTIRLEPLFDILGELKFEQQQIDEQDIDAIELLEHIGELTLDLFATSKSNPLPGAAELSTRQSKRMATTDPS
ncbi:MAG: hypothetical protein DHS20C01_16180 [marine bacterium B5-7]|nr:MAG: hypothetical protein DHS20C01_16180 [marine bacterium B5-7]